jgi:hypothetical protein
MKRTYKSIANLLGATILLSCLTVITNAQSLSNNVVDYGVLRMVDERSYFEKIVEIGHQAETVDELIKTSLGYGNVTEVWVFRNVDDFQDGVQIFNGDVQYEMIVKVFYDNKPLVEYLILPPLENYNSTNSQVTPAVAGFTLPIDNIDLSRTQSQGGNRGCPFGCRCTPLHGTSNGGVDIVSGGSVAPIRGVKIRTVRSGVVSRIWANDPTLGNAVRIRHSTIGYETLYSHMEGAPLVVTGNIVSKGQIIGLVGSSGATTGAHLHFELQEGSALTPRDPLPFLQGRPTWRAIEHTVTVTVPGGGAVTVPNSTLNLQFDDIVTINATFPSGSNIGVSLVTPDGSSALGGSEEIHGFLNLRLRTPQEGSHFIRVRNLSTSSRRVTITFNTLPCSWPVYRQISRNAMFQVPNAIYMRAGDTLTVNMGWLDTLYEPVGRTVFSFVMPSGALLSLPVRDGNANGIIFTASQSGVHYLQIRNEHPNHWIIISGTLTLRER